MSDFFLTEIDHYLSAFVELRWLHREKPWQLEINYEIKIIKWV